MTRKAKATTEEKTPLPLQIERDPDIAIDEPTSSKAAELTTSKRVGPKFRWTEDREMELIKQCQEKMIWQVKYGLEAKVWEKIARVLNSKVTLGGGFTSGQLSLRPTYIAHSRLLLAHPWLLSPYFPYCLFSP